MRSLALIVALASSLASSGCRTRACRDGTLLVTLTLQGAASSADSLRVSVAIDDDPPSVHPAPTHGSPTGTVEVIFAPYPTGHKLTLEVVALSKQTEVGAGSRTLMLAAGCDYTELRISPATLAADLGIDAACVPSATSCPDNACGKVDNGCGGFVTCTNSCLVTSLSPTLANTDDTVVIEGLFSQTGATTVDFPGAPGQPVTVLGAARATAKVPATATAGALTVRTGNTNFGPFQFRRANYKLGAPDFSFREPQNNVGTATPRALLGRIYHATVNINDRLFLIGGALYDSAPKPYKYIERLDISVDGSVARSSLLSSTLEVARFGHTANDLAGSVFVVGGSDGATAFDSVERSIVDSSGSLGAFTTKNQPRLNVARSLHSATVIGAYLYVLGGVGTSTDAGTNHLASIERALINSDGSLGSFELYSAAALVHARAKHSAIATETNLYVIAGEDDSGMPLTSIEVAPIHSDGSIGSFSLAPSQIDIGSLWNMVQVGRAVYLETDNRLEQASIDGNGVLSDFQLINQSAPRRYHGQLTVARDYVYLTGGHFDSRGLNEILRAPVNASGELGTFAVDHKNRLNFLRTGAVFFVTDNYVYVLGGEDGGIGGENQGIVERGSFGADDSFNGFAPYTAARLSMGRTSPAAFVGQAATYPYANELYIAGGQNIDEQNDLNTVELAPIDSSGNLGVFSPAPPMQTGRTGAHGFNGNCVLAGVSDFSYLRSKECLTNGIWTLTDGVLQTGRSEFAFLAYGGSEWILGGSVAEQILADGTSRPTTVTTPATFVGASSVALVGPYVYLFAGKGGVIARAPVADSTLADNFSSVPNAILQVPRSAAGVLVVGNLLYVMGGDWNSAVESALLK
jgi:hypothetical protein